MIRYICILWNDDHIYLIVSITSDVAIQLFSHVWLFAIPWTVARQASVFHYLLEFAQTHVHWVGDAI